MAHSNASRYAREHGMPVSEAFKVIMQLEKDKKLDEVMGPIRQRQAKTTKVQDEKVVGLLYPEEPPRFPKIPNHLEILKTFGRIEPSLSVPRSPVKITYPDAVIGSNTFAVNQLNQQVVGVDKTMWTLVQQQPGYNRDAVANATKWIATSGPLSGMYARFRDGMSRPKYRPNEVRKYSQWGQRMSRMLPVDTEKLPHLDDQVTFHAGWENLVNDHEQLNVKSSPGFPYINLTKEDTLEFDFARAHQIFQALRDPVAYDKLQADHPDLFLVALRNKWDRYERSRLEEKIRAYFVFPACHLYAVFPVTRPIQAHLKGFWEHPESCSAYKFNWFSGGARRLLNRVADAVDTPHLVSFGDDVLIFVRHGLDAEVASIDITQMDLSLGESVHHHVYSYVKLSYGKKLGGTWDRVARMMARRAFFCHLNVGGTLVFDKYDGNASGGPLTTIINMIVITLEWSEYKLQVPYKQPFFAYVRGFIAWLKSRNLIVKDDSVHHCRVPGIQALLAKAPGDLPTRKVVMSTPFLGRVIITDPEGIDFIPVQSTFDQYKVTLVPRGYTPPNLTVTEDAARKVASLVGVALSSAFVNEALFSAVVARFGQLYSYAAGFVSSDMIEDVELDQTAKEALDDLLKIGLPTASTIVDLYRDPSRRTRVWSANTVSVQAGVQALASVEAERLSDLETVASASEAVADVPTSEAADSVKAALAAYTEWAELAPSPQEKTAHTIGDIPTVITPSFREKADEAKVVSTVLPTDQPLLASKSGLAQPTAKPKKEPRAPAPLPTKLSRAVNKSKRVVASAKRAAQGKRVLTSEAQDLFGDVAEENDFESTSVASDPENEAQFQAEIMRELEDFR